MQIFLFYSKYDNVRSNKTTRVPRLIRFVRCTYVQLHVLPRTESELPVQLQLSQSSDYEKVEIMTE